MPAKIGCCERFCTNFQVLTLQTFNLVDFLIGCALVALGSYVEHTTGVKTFNDPIAYVIAASIALGALMLLTTFLSFIALTNVGCRCLSYPSAMFALVLFLITLVLGAAGCYEQNYVYSYVDDHAKEKGISEDDINLFKEFYRILKFVMFGIAAEQLIRFIFSMKYRNAAVRMDGEYDLLMDEDQKDWNERIGYNQTNRTEKYSDMRAHYKAKYSTNRV
jgi:hypothetical protein